jgi:hypothetical protein
MAKRFRRIPGARLWAIAITGRIIAVLGAGLLVLAALFFFAAVGPRGYWDFPGSGFFMTAAVVLAVPGAGGLLLGIHLVRQDRDLREFNEAMELNNRESKNE